MFGMPRASQDFLPGLKLILPRRYVFEDELTLFVGHRIEGVFGDYYPTTHPGVEIAIHTKDLRALEPDRNRPRVRLRTVERGILLAAASYIM